MGWMRKLIALIAVMTMTAVPASFAASGPLSPHRGLGAVVASESTQPGPERYRADAKRRTKQSTRRSVRRKQRAERARLAHASAPAVPAALQSIARCESGGDPRAIGGGGLYRGKYQFSRETWAAVGGSGDPARAPEAEQDRRAIQLYAQSGPGQWPVCGA